MSIFGRWLGCAIAVLACTNASGQSAGHGDNGQLPKESAASDSPREMVRETARTEMAADAADHSLWLYYEVDSKPRDGVVQWAAQTRSGEIDRVLEQDGRKLSAQEARSKMDNFARDRAAQARQSRSGQQDDKRATEMLNMLPDAFIWTIAKRDGTTTTLHFRPDPSFHAPSWEARVFASMEGDLVVDNAQHRIMSLRGKIIDSVKFGWGILGELEPGGSFEVERRQMGHGVWEITETHVHIQGHAVLFHSISDQEDDVKSKFEPLREDITLERAEQKLLEK